MSRLALVHPSGFPDASEFVLRSSCATITVDSGRSKRRLLIPESRLRVVRQWPLGLNFLRGVIVLTKTLELTVFDCDSNALHVLLVVVKIVDCIELRAKDFIALIEVMKISATKILTGVAATVWIEGLIAVLMA